MRTTQQSKLSSAEQRQYDETVYLQTYLSGLSKVCRKEPKDPKSSLLTEADLKSLLCHMEYLVTKSGLQHLISGFELMNDVVIEFKKKVDQGKPIDHPKTMMRLIAKFRIMDKQRQFLAPYKSASRKNCGKPEKIRIYYSEKLLKNFPDWNIYEIVDDWTITAVQDWLHTLNEADQILITQVHMNGISYEKTAQILENNGLGYVTSSALRKRSSRLLKEARNYFPER